MDSVAAGRLTMKFLELISELIWGSVVKIVLLVKSTWWFHLELLWYTVHLSGVYLVVHQLQASDEEHLLLRELLIKKHKPTGKHQSLAKRQEQHFSLIFTDDTV